MLLPVIQKVIEDGDIDFWLLKLTDGDLKSWKIYVGRPRVL